MPMSSPFILDEPIQEPKYFVGRKRHVRDILSRLWNMDSSSILGEWHAGKTSLLKYISNPGVLKQSGFDPIQYVFIYLDLLKIDRSENPLRFWNLVLEGVFQRVKDEDLRSAILAVQKRPDLDARDIGNLLEDMGAQGYKLVLLLDEFDNVTGNPNFDIEFYNKLRALAIGPNLVLITSSRRELVEACYSSNTSTSPFFNIFANIDVGLLTAEEANLLINNGLENTSVTFNQEEDEYLLVMAGCQPFFLQVACHNLYAAYVQGLESNERYHFVLDEMRKKAPSFFARVWNNATQEERITLTAMALLQVHQNKGDIDIDALRDLVSRVDKELRGLLRRGLINQKNDRYSLFSSLFQEWIVEFVFAPTGISGDTLNQLLGSFDDTRRSWIYPDYIKAISRVRPERHDLIKFWLEAEPRGVSERILSVMGKVVMS